MKLLDELKKSKFTKKIRQNERDLLDSLTSRKIKHNFSLFDNKGICRKWGPPRVCLHMACLRAGEVLTVLDIRGLGYRCKETQGKSRFQMMNA